MNNAVPKMIPVLVRKADVRKEAPIMAEYSTENFLKLFTLSFCE
jgi:hypothetical protein